MLAFICILCIVIWILNLQSKLNNISNRLDFIKHKLERLEDGTHPVKEIKPETTSAENNAGIPEVSESVIVKNYDYCEFNESAIDKQPKKAENPDFGLQGALLGNVFNKIGAVAIIIALIIFIKLVSPFFVLTNTIKVVLGFVLGIGLSVGSIYMHRSEKLKSYSEVLLGTGFGVLFINTFCSYSYFHVLNGVAVLCIASVLLLATFLIADRMKTLSMLVIGLIGGYLTPFLAKSGNDILFTYLIFLNILSLIFSLRNSKAKYVNIVNLLLSMFIFTGYNIFSKISYIYPLILWAVYIIYDFLKDKDNLADDVLCYINYALLTLFTVTTVGRSQLELGCLLGGVAFAYLLLGQLSRKNNTELFKFYDNSVLINLWLFVFFISNDLHSVVFWSVILMVIAFCIKNCNCRHLGGILIGYGVSLFAGVLMAKVGGKCTFLEVYNPIINMRGLIFGVPILSMIVTSLMLDKEHQKLSDIIKFSWLSLAYLYVVGELNSILVKFSQFNTSDNRLMIYLILGFVYALNTRKLYNTSKCIIFNVASYVIGGVSLLTLLISSYFVNGFLPVINLRLAAYLSSVALCVYYARSTKLSVFKYLAVFVGFLAFHFEGVGIYKFNHNMLYAISLLWVLYSGATTIWGICSNKRYLINSGIALIILSIIRIFIYDLANVEPIYKLIAFLALGVILMLVSYIYNVKRK